MPSVQEVKYREQYVAAFEANPGFLRQAVTSEVINQGGQLVFLVAGSGNRSAVTRGSNGLIPVADDSQTQVPVTLAASYDKQVRNGFDIFTAQSDQLTIMRNNGVAVMNRKIDDVILQGMYAGSISISGTVTMSKTTANIISTKLRNAHAGEADRGNLFCALSNAAWAYMTDITSFANVNYSDTGGSMQNGVPVQGMWKYWMGINWAEHPGLTGVGTSSCACVAWHRNAMGHTISPSGVSAEMGQVPGEDASYVLHKVYHGAALLQNSGIIQFTHDDSAYS